MVFDPDALIGQIVTSVLFRFLVSIGKKILEKAILDLTSKNIVKWYEKVYQKLPKKNKDIVPVKTKIQYVPVSYIENKTYFIFTKPNSTTHDQKCKARTRKNRH